MDEAAARRAPTVAGVAGGVGTTTIARALAGSDRGVFTGRPVDVLVCRATADSLVRAARAAYLISTQQQRRPVLAVNSGDVTGPSRPSAARMRLLEPHTAGVVVLPYVRRWPTWPPRCRTSPVCGPPGDRAAAAVAPLRHSRAHPRPQPRPPNGSHLAAALVRSPPTRAAPVSHHLTEEPTVTFTILPARLSSALLLAVTQLAQPPDPPPAPPPGLTEITNRLVSWMKWGVVVVGVMGLLICAMMIIIGRRNRSATAYEGLVGSAWVLAGLGLASVAALIVGGSSWARDDHLDICHRCRHRATSAHSDLGDTWASVRGMGRRLSGRAGRADRVPVAGRRDRPGHRRVRRLGHHLVDHHPERGPVRIRRSGTSNM